MRNICDMSIFNHIETHIMRKCYQHVTSKALSSFSCQWCNGSIGTVDVRLLDHCVLIGSPHSLVGAENTQSSAATDFVTKYRINYYL